MKECHCDQSYEGKYMKRISITYMYNLILIPIFYCIIEKLLVGEMISDSFWINWLSILITEDTLKVIARKTKLSLIF